LLPRRRELRATFCEERGRRVMWLQDVDQYVVMSEESGTARCPFERTHNSTTHYSGMVLHSDVRVEIFLYFFTARLSYCLFM